MLRLEADEKGNALIMQMEQCVFKLSATGQEVRKIGLTRQILFSENVSTQTKQEPFQGQVSFFLSFSNLFIICRICHRKNFFLLSYDLLASASSFL